MVAADRNRLEAKAEKGSRRARVAVVLHKRLSFHLSGAQLGLTVVSLVFGFVAEPALSQTIQPLLPFSDATSDAIALVLSLAIATTLSMVGGELIPKNLVIADPEGAALWLAQPLRLFNIVLAPFITLANGLANWLVRRLGVEPQDEDQTGVRSLEELASLIRRSKASGAIEEERAALLDRSIRFGAKTAADALVPRIQVAVLPADATLTDLVVRSLGTGHSRFPVVRNDLDDVVGVVHVKDVFGTERSEWPTTPVDRILVDALAVPETVPLDDLFDSIRSAQAHLAVVVDEHGGTAGIVTLEDVLEELVGEIDDEYDPPTTAARFEDATGSWILAGSLHPDEVEEASGFAVPPGEYDTVAGFILDRLGHIPVLGEIVTYDGWVLEVLAMDRRRIATLRIRPPADRPQLAPPAGRA